MMKEGENITSNVGQISESIKTLLRLTINGDHTIYLGESNINHMQSRHPEDYIKYGQHIPLILSHPDYVGINPSDNSIEYVKEFEMDNEFVKVAIRISSKDKYYARSLYVLNSNRVHNFIVRGTLKPIYHNT